MRRPEIRVLRAPPACFTLGEGSWECSLFVRALYKVTERNMCRCGESDSVDDFTAVGDVKLSADDDMEVSDYCSLLCEYWGSGLMQQRRVHDNLWCEQIMEATARQLEEMRLALVQELSALLDDIYRWIDEHATPLQRL
uniref:Uncharacterized protein n=1 Tax=Parascaris univalens TaxID=6257 RepID=A0A915A2M8_PARUN